MPLSNPTRQWLNPITVAAGLVVGVCLGMLAQERAEKPPLHVTVTEPEDANGTITVMVRNDSSKTIEEWGVSAVLPDGKMFTRSEREPPDKLFAPNETRTVRLGARGSRDLRVSVIFEDLTATGEEEILNAYFAVRRRRLDHMDLWVKQLRALLGGHAGSPSQISAKLTSFEADETDALVRFHAAAVRIALAGAATEARANQLQEILATSERDLEKARVASVRRR